MEEWETYLGKIDQSDSYAMKTALSPAFGSLVKPRLLRHHDEVIRLAALSCISEIMRIIAGPNSYDDQIMREVLHAMVKSFEKLDDIRDPYFTKRARLLEVFARYRFENIMLTVGCIGDIRRMFNTFWNILDEFHPSSVLASMHSIMFTILFEEEDEISKLLAEDLWYVWTKERNLSPMACTWLKSLIDRPKDRSTFPMTGRNLYDEFDRHADPVQGDISTSSGNGLSASSSQAEVVTDVVQVEPVASEGDITGTPDCVIDTDSDSSTVGLDEVTAVEDTVMFEDSTVDQKVSIQDFAENEYQAQLDASSHEIEASSSSLGLASQLKTKEKDIVAALSHHDRMHGLIENHIWMIQLQERQKGVTAGSSCDDLQQIKEGMEAMKVSYTHLLSDRDHLLNLAGIYSDALKKKEEEVDRLSHELEDTRNSLVCT